MDENLNIYIGDETTKKCKLTFYELLMAGEQVTPHMILARIAGEDIHAFDDLDLDYDLPSELAKFRIEQKQIMRPMYELLKKYVGNDIERFHIGNHRFAYKYHGSDKDPLRDMRLSAVKKSIEEFKQFCLDSAGFFPKSWLEHFFKNTQELLDIKETEERGEAVMSVSVDRLKDNINLLPLLYESIKNKQIIEFDYRQQYGSEVEHRRIHPHFLHEFNGRWHLFGYEKEGEMSPANIAIDRIEGEVMIPKTREAYVPAEPGFYTQYFENMLGVTHGIPPTSLDWRESKPHHVRVRAYNKYMYGLTSSKPIHHSQTPCGEYDENLNYGDFDLYLELNNEFIGRILQMGPGLEIISPPEYREIFAQRVAEMAQKYGIIVKSQEI